MSRSRKKLLLIIAGVVSAIFALTGPLMVQGWRQYRSFDKFFSRYSQSLVREDFQSLYESSTPEFKTATPFTEFVRMSRQLTAERGSLVSVKKGRTIVEGRGNPMKWVAVTTAKLTFARSPMALTYEFHLEDGDWRLFGFQPD